MNLEVKSMPKWGNLDLENLIKAEMDNFDEGIWCYLSVQQADRLGLWGTKPMLLGNLM